MNDPFFSVVIPTHNRSTLLKRALDSVLNQTFQDFEIIVVDDHSTDDTPNIIKKYSDKRLKYAKNNRLKGACGARNTGIFSAKGQWVAFLDDDDSWFPDKLKEQYQLIERSSEKVGLVCSDYAIYKGIGKRLRKIKNRPAGWVRDKILYGGIIGCLSSTVVKADILSKIGGFDESFPSCQDQDLWLQVAGCSEFASVPKTLVLMYQEKRDRIGQNHKGKMDGYIKLRNKYFDIIGKSLRLRHRHESIIFTYASLLNEKSIAKKSFPWLVFGLFVDFPKCIFTIRTSYLILYRNRKTIRFFS